MQASTLFVTSHGSDGFVSARVQRRMKGDSFFWKRAGIPPADGSRFEIRPKSGSSLLDPSTPNGVDEIRATANRSSAQQGSVYTYSLWQVLADGRERDEPADGESEEVRAGRQHAGEEADDRDDVTDECPQVTLFDHAQVLRAL